MVDIEDTWYYPQDLIFADTDVDPLEWGGYVSWNNPKGHNVFNTSCCSHLVDSYKLYSVMQLNATKPPTGDSELNAGRHYLKTQSG